MSAGFTPGPWVLGKGPTTDKPCILAADGTWICGQIINQSVMASEGAANANLIAAAPELYEALASAVELLDDIECGYPLRYADALRKARGDLADPLEQVKL